MRWINSGIGAVVAAALFLGACDNPSGSDVGPPAQLTVLAGDLQTAPAGTELPQALVVRVTDDKGKPVAGQIVNFRVTAGGGTVFAGAAETNDDGEARERWTLGYVIADTQRVEARVVDPTTGQALVLGSFRAMATAGAAAAVQDPQGSGQTGLVGQPLATPLSVRVVDAGGNPVPGATVTWSGQGTFGPAPSVTGADGRAQATWTLGTTAGPQTAQAAVGSSTAAFTATAATSTEVPGRLVITPESVTAVVGLNSQPVEWRWVDVYGNSSSIAFLEWRSLEPLIVSGSPSLGTYLGRTVGTTRTIGSVTTSRGTFSDTVTVTVTPGEERTYALGTETAPTFRAATGVQSDFWVAGPGNQIGVLARVTGTTVTQPALWTLVGLNGVWGPSNSSLFAVGESGIILRYDGGTVSLSPSGTQNRLSSVWGSSATDVWAGGDAGTLLHYDGSGWSSVSFPTTENISEVWVAPTGELFVAAGNTVYRRVGTSWSARTFSSAVASLQGSASATDAVVVAEGDVQRWNGTAWETLPTVTYTPPLGGAPASATFSLAGISGGQVYGIAHYFCTSRDDCYNLYRYENGAWTFLRQVGSIGRGQNSSPHALIRLRDGSLVALYTFARTSVVVPAPAAAARARSRSR